MNNTYSILFDQIENKKETILAAERYIWTHPETGFREWNTHNFLKAHFERLGYDVHEAIDIPGFYADIDTGKPGPKIGVFGEMDGLIVMDHPERDPKTGAVHACGHNAQCAALLGIAIALKAEGALDGLVGSIRLFAVPSEEMIELSFRKELMDKGILHFCGGKQEFLYRGYLDGVDMAIMVHTGSKGFSTNTGCNGCMNKRFTFIGKAAHAAGPANSKNALAAANTAMAAANALRESFNYAKLERYAAIIARGGEAVNVIPAEVEVECIIRGRTMESIIALNEKINRAYAAGALSQGCRLIMEDMLGYSPRIEDRNLQNAFTDVAHLLFAEEEIKLRNPPAAGCTDMGDISTVMPVCHAFVGGFAGGGHSASFRIEDPYTACVKSAKLQAGVLAHLLENDAALAKKVIAEKEVQYPSVAAYLEAAEKLAFKGDAITYHEDGTINIKIKN